MCVWFCRAGVLVHGTVFEGMLMKFVCTRVGKRRRRVCLLVLVLAVVLPAAGLAAYCLFRADPPPPEPPVVPAPRPAPAPPEPPVAAEILDGRVLPAQSPHLTRLPDEFANKPTFVHRDAVEDLLALIRAAKADGITLTVVSGFRSYWHQQSIWNKKWQNVGDAPDDAARLALVLRFSAVPALSRHHWGTDVDFNSVDDAYWQGAEGRAVSAWLRANARRYGFCQVYDGRAQGRRAGGHEDEAWHWSHLPSAAPLHRQRSARLDEARYPDLHGSDILQGQGAMLRPFVDSLAPECTSAKPISTQNQSSSAVSPPS